MINETLNQTIETKVSLISCWNNTILGSIATVLLIYSIIISLFVVIFVIIIFKLLNKNKEGKSNG